MKPWMQKIIDMLLFRQQARADGATAAEANQAAVLSALVKKEQEVKKP